MKNNICYKESMPGTEARGPHDLPITIKVSAELLRLLDDLARSTARSRSSVARLLMQRGVRLYRLDGELLDRELPPELLKGVQNVNDIPQYQGFQDFGTVDAFLADVIMRYDSPETVLQVWYEREGWPADELSVPEFKGWSDLNLDQKVKAIKTHRSRLVRHIKRNEKKPPETTDPSE